MDPVSLAISVGAFSAVASVAAAVTAFVQSLRKRHSDRNTLRITLDDGTEITLAGQDSQVAIEKIVSIAKKEGKSATAG